MAEIEKSFTFLHDIIPQWLHDVASVQEKVAAMQHGILKVPVSVSPFAKHTSESVESIRPARMDAIAEEAAPSRGAQTDPVGNRTRKPLSVLSGRASVPSRYRPRTMVVVSYDGDMQKSFELLVRAIGAGRNLLRKAKMEAKMNELAALAGSSDDEDDANNDQDEAIVAKISYRPRMSSMRARFAATRGGGHGASAPVSLFDTTDKSLEHAQGLCEKAAHLTLRDGDCRKELECITKSLGHVLETARTKVGEFTTARSLVAQDAPLHEPSDPALSSVEPAYKRHFPQMSLPPPVPQPVPQSHIEPETTMLSVPRTTVPMASKTMEIEVDDDDDDDEEEFVMPPVRLTSRFRGQA